MKVGVLSDIHAESDALFQVQQKMDIDRICFLGDLFDRGEHGVMAYQLFKDWFSRNPENNVWLCGNHDRAAAWARDDSDLSEFSSYFNSLEDSQSQEKCRNVNRGIAYEYVKEAANRPSESFITIGQIPIYLTHGFPNSDESKRLIQYDHRNHPNSGINFKELSNLASKARIWLVGHSHRQTAWFYKAGEPGEWVELIQGFGTTTNGVARNHNDVDKTAEIDFDDYPEGSFLILNPGSVGFPRDLLYNNGNRVAKYLTLEINTSVVKTSFHSIHIV